MPYKYISIYIYVYLYIYLLMYNLRASDSSSGWKLRGMRLDQYPKLLYNPSIKEYRNFTSKHQITINAVKCNFENIWMGCLTD